MTLININCNEVPLATHTVTDKNDLMVKLIFSILSKNSLNGSLSKDNRRDLIYSITSKCLLEDGTEFGLLWYRKYVRLTFAIKHTSTGPVLNKELTLKEFSKKDEILDNYKISGLSNDRNTIDVTNESLIQSFSLMGVMDNLDLVDKETGLLRVRKPHKYPSFMEVFNLPLCYDNQINEYRHDNSIEFINLFYSDYILQYQLTLLEDPTIPGALKEPLLQLTGELVLKTLDSEYKDVLLKRSKMTEVELKRKLMELEFLKK